MIIDCREVLDAREENATLYIHRAGDHPDVIVELSLASAPVPEMTQHKTYK